MQNLITTDGSDNQVLEIGESTYDLMSIEGVGMRSRTKGFVFRLDVAVLAGMVAHFGGAAVMTVIGLALLTGFLVGVPYRRMEITNEPHEVYLKMRVGMRTVKTVIAHFPNRAEARKLYDKVSEILVVRDLENSMFAQDLLR